jgi:hypothetical protein
MSVGIVRAQKVGSYAIADGGFWSGGGQLSDCNSLSGSNSLTNRVLNEKLIIFHLVPD